MKPNLRRLGQAVLMSTAMGLTASACTTTVKPTPRPVAPQPQSTAVDRQYAEALASRSPALVTSFIRTHRSDPRSATLLNRMPASVLVAVPRSAVRGLDPGVQRRLSTRVRSQFGLAAPATSRPPPLVSRVGAGYNG